MLSSIQQSQNVGYIEVNSNWFKDDDIVLSWNYFFFFIIIYNLYACWTQINNYHGIYEIYTNFYTNTQSSTLYTEINIKN